MMELKASTRISHPVFGLGTIVEVIKKGLYDGRDFPNYNGGPNGESVPSNGKSRYKGSPNVLVKFDNGGPMGFAEDATNNIKDLKEVN